jgi:3-oxoacyl-[acyl-carrier protein] reductase
LKLAAKGLNLVVHGGHDRPAAEQVAKEVRAQGRCAEVIMADLRQASDRQELIDVSWRQHPIDVWINNAGADVLTGPAAKLSFDEKLDLLWQVDVQATVQLSRGAGARMRQQAGGCLLNIGWDQAEVGMGGDSGEMFAAIKGAVMAFSRSLAKSLAPHVRVNCLAPGWIRTAWGEDAPYYWHQRAQEESLVGRWGTAEDVACAAAWLTSPAADFVNGQVIAVNGGFAGHAHPDASHDAHHDASHDAGQPTHRPRPVDRI